MKLSQHSLLVNVFWIYYTDNCHSDNELLPVYYAYATAVNSVYEDFRSTVCCTRYIFVSILYVCIVYVICTFDTLQPAGVINYSLVLSF